MAALSAPICSSASVTCQSLPASTRARGGRYHGRFAPSPTGDLHAGSLVAALGSWLDARAHGGSWSLRIEDADQSRVVPGAANRIVEVLAACGMTSDHPVTTQRDRSARYLQALAQISDSKGPDPPAGSPGIAVFGCRCSRRTLGLRAAMGIDDSTRVYPGTCRGQPADQGLAWRVRVPELTICFDDRAFGPQQQALHREVGDFVVRRADGSFTYQWAVVIDDGDAGITDVVRGADLLDNTPRQIFLQQRLGLRAPRYLHLPVVNAADGRKLSKQNGATPIDRDRALPALRQAAEHLGLDVPAAASVSAFLELATACWGHRWVRQ